jgi:hypothetical protein
VLPRYFHFCPIPRSWSGTFEATRDPRALAALATYETSPELTLNGQWIQSPIDGSGVVVPSATWTLSDRLSLLGSFCLPNGAAPEGLTLQSTYGAAAISGLLQIRIYI